MTWQAQRKMIRRYLRDPDANIWSDGDILRAYNMTQQEFTGHINLESMQHIRIPPRFRSSYMHFWEWEYSNHTEGYVYEFGYPFNSYLCTQIWEPEHLTLGQGAISISIGTAYTHPWEAWTSITPDKPPLLWAPDAFHTMLFLAYDKKPLDASTLKEVMSDDPTWQSRGGTTMAYYRSEKLENFIIPYPMPSTVKWDDETGEGDIVLFRNDGSDNDTVDSENGIIIDYSDSYCVGIFGGTYDIISQDNNLTMVFRFLPKDVGDDQNAEPSYQDYLQKYIRYGTLERCFRMNTDGRIESLAQYWQNRKQIGFGILLKFKGKRKADRDYRLRTKGVPFRRTRRHPRLPDAYPAVWP